MRYKIHDYEADKIAVVEAPGIVEAMHEYLPWPTLQLVVNYGPSNGRATVADCKTDFIYEVTF